MRKLGLLLIVLAVACQQSPTLTPFLAAAPLTPTVRVQQLATPLPTHTPRPLFASLTPSPTPTSTLASTPVPTFSVALPTPTLAANDPLANHLLLGRPIVTIANNTVYRVYPYGGTNNGRLQVHHGVDLVNPIGTPILAAADGKVIYAGNDFTVLFATMNNYYGKLVVIQHDLLSAEGLPVFTLYGHMEYVTVQAGQTISAGSTIGMVGATGIALGPHLHFEVRIGNPFDFDATRNPELWLRPFPNFGVLAGRIVDADGRLVYGATLIARSSQLEQRAFTYGDQSVNPDPTLDENFTLGDLPAGDYTVTVVAAGRARFERQISVAPNTITWLDAQLAP